MCARSLLCSRNLILLLVLRGGTSNNYGEWSFGISQSWSTHITCTCMHILGLLANITIGKTLTSLACSMTSLTETIITSWTCSNHFSTAPRAADVEIDWLSFTFSPSLLNIDTMSRLSRNSSLQRVHNMLCECVRIS